MGMSAKGVSAYRIVCPGGVHPHCMLGYTPEQNDWQTGVKTLPCPKLRLRAVMN